MRQETSKILGNHRSIYYNRRGTVSGTAREINLYCPGCPTPLWVGTAGQGGTVVAGTAPLASWPILARSPPRRWTKRLFVEIINPNSRLARSPPRRWTKRLFVEIINPNSRLARSPPRRVVAALVGLAERLADATTSAAARDAASAARDAAARAAARAAASAAARAARDAAASAAASAAARAARDAAMDAASAAARAARDAAQAAESAAESDTVLRQAADTLRECCCMRTTAEEAM
jgi:hypothetical protein